MKTRIINHFNHKCSLKLEIGKPINPVYKERMYISGWLFGFNTEYKKELVSCDGYEDVWTCAICGRLAEDSIHDDIILESNKLPKEL